MKLMRNFSSFWIKSMKRSKICFLSILEKKFEKMLKFLILIISLILLKKVEFPKKNPITFFKNLTMEENLKN